MFNETEWSELVGELIGLTLKDRISWENDYENPGSYDAKVNDFLYSVGSVDSDGRLPYFFAINKILGTNENTGEPTLQWLATLESIPPSNETSRIRDEISKSIVVLRDLAVRSAKGTPKLFESLLNDLKSLEDPWS